MNEEMKLDQCGCGGNVKVVNLFGDKSQFMVVCTGCGLKTAVHHSREAAVGTWNRAMGTKMSGSKSQKKKENG